jgi:hypothetical protein
MTAVSAHTAKGKAGIDTAWRDDNHHRGAQDVTSDSSSGTVALLSRHAAFSEVRLTCAARYAFSVRIVVDGFVGLRACGLGHFGS